MDVVTLAQALIRYPSVSPQGAGSLEFVAAYLETRGFTVQRFDRGATQNLYARRGIGTSVVCYVGHVDVVPPGAQHTWRYSPFAGEINEGYVWGRGAVDMKGSIAAFLSCINDLKDDVPLSLLLTSDEEADATDGIQYAAPLIFDNTQNRPEFFLVGEPTSEERVGDTLKVGRRGSLSATLILRGVQGHVAYPHKAENPIPRLIKALCVLQDFKWDEGDKYFDPTHLEISSIDVGNIASNVIPAEATAKFNLRFNTHYQGQQLHDLVRALLQPYMSERDSLQFRLSGEPFISQPYAKREEIIKALANELGTTPQISTSGGTSDARFLHGYAPVMELGLRNELAHQVDERVSLNDLRTLVRAYQCLLQVLTQR